MSGECMCECQTSYHVPVLPYCREFLQPSHRARFDTITPGHTVTTRRGSVNTLVAKPRPLAATR